MNPISPVGQGTTAESTQDVTGTASRLANQDIFMKLLVAQLRYQNPMKPADGVEFMSQLTQFSQLEQTVSIRKELESMKAMIATIAGTATAAAEKP